MRLVERALSFWLSFGVTYCVMRWAFTVGHLAAALAYVTTQVTFGFADQRRAAR